MSKEKLATPETEPVKPRATDTLGRGTLALLERVRTSVLTEPTGKHALSPDRTMQVTPTELGASLTFQVPVLRLRTPKHAVESSTPYSNRANTMTEAARIQAIPPIGPDHLFTHHKDSDISYRGLAVTVPRSGKKRQARKNIPSAN